MDRCLEKRGASQRLVQMWSKCGPNMVQIWSKCSWCFLKHRTDRGRGKFGCKFLWESWVASLLGFWAPTALQMWQLIIFLGRASYIVTVSVICSCPQLSIKASSPERYSHLSVPGHQLEPRPKSFSGTQKTLSWAHKRCYMECSLLFLGGW